jgi:hypothetical protein
MWGIEENQFKVFNYIYERDNSKEFNFMCIIDYEKWNSLYNVKELLELALQVKELEIVDVEIKNPDNPAKLIGAKLIKFSR